MRRAAEIIELRNVLLPDMIQLGLFLQTMQKEQPSADLVTSLIGHILSHLPHPLHFSSFMVRGGLLSKSLMHESILSTSIAFI